MVAISGRVAIAPFHKNSKAGNGYCEFVILDKKDLPHECIAFDKPPSFLAKALCAELSIDIRVAVHGEEKDGKLFVRSFTLLEKMEAIHGQRYQPKAPPRSRMDALMDALTPGYVVSRLRQFLGTGDIKKVLRGFDSKGYEQLLRELDAEAHGEKKL